MTTVVAVTLNGSPLGQISLADADAARITAQAIANRKGSIIETPAVAADPNANPPVVGSPAVMRDPTAAEALNLAAQDFFQTLITQAVAAEQAAASAAAAAAVAPIVPQ